MTVNRVLTVILLLAVILLLFLWLTARSDLRSATERFRGDLSFYRGEIIRTCTFTATTTEAEKRACESVLEDFGEMLRDYRATLVDSIASSTMPTSTPQTTPTTTATTTATTTVR